MASGKKPALTSDEHSMIFSNHFSIKFLPVGQAKAPANDWSQILLCAIQVAGAMILSMLAFVLPWYLAALSVLFCGMILFSRVATLVVFGLAVVRGKYTKAFYVPSVVFWGWWPMWLLFFVVMSMAVGALIGNYIWTGSLKPYWKYSELQMYKDLNPDTVPGERVQDAGLVTFTNFAEMDRAKGGCYMHAGDTYCVAPIVNGGEVKYGLKGVPHSGSFDYFAVGMNCCSCPNRDFKCGEWRNPMANGGLRSLDEKARPFYSLALDDWKASFGKSSNHPMFFDWVQSPEWVWKGMWNRALEVGWLAAALGLSMGLTIGFVMDKLLQFLWAKDIVVPRSCLAPAPGLGSVTEVLMPRMFYRYQEEQANIASMPVSAEWVPQRGPGEKRDLNKAEFGARDSMRGSSLIEDVITAPGAPGRGFGYGSMPTAFGPSYSMY